MTAILFRYEARIMEEKIIEMPIKNAEDVWRLIMTQVDGALSFKGLDPEEREEIEAMRVLLDRGYLKRNCDGPEARQDAARLMMLGAFRLGTLTAVSNSGKEYWRRVSCSNGGGKKDPDTKVWQDWATAIITQNPNLKASEITDSLLVDTSAPDSLPESYEHLIKFVRKTRKRIVAK
jgi:hypothetical protein